jgi:hypothetical protein
MREVGERKSLRFYYILLTHEVNCGNFQKNKKQKNKRLGQVGILKEDARTDAICETECAGCFDTAADVLDRSTCVTDEPGAIVNILEEATCEYFEARDDAFARESLDGLYRTRLRNLYLQCTLAKAET